MKKALSYALLCILPFLPFVVLAEAEAGHVTGVVIEKSTGEPMSYVNISIKDTESGEFLPGGAMSDEDGKFVLRNLKPYSYTLVFSYLGYAPYEAPIVISAADNVVDLSRIFLAEDATRIDDIRVTGMRSQMRFDIDKKIFNVDQNIASTGGSASDILSNIPSVDVDNEGEVSLRGSTSVTVWINGKASGLTADNRAQILEQLPAESIEKIEVITNPSARYSPEGTAGIINIVLKKDRRGGYYGSFQAGGDTRGGYNVSGNYNYSSGKLDAYGSLGYRNRERRSGNESHRTNYVNDQEYFLDRTGKSKGNHNNLFARAGLTYNPTGKDHFTIGGFGMFGGGKNKNTNRYTSNIPGSYTGSTRLTRSDDDMQHWNAEFGYKREFGENHNLDFMVTFSKWDSDATSVYEQTSDYDSGGIVSSYQRQLRDMNNKNWEIQLDYINQLNKNHRVEAGYKGTIGREDSPVETYSGTNAENAIFDDQLYNRFLYDRDIHALYATYSGRAGNLSFNAGLRGEYSDLSTRSPGFGETVSGVARHKNDYFSLFPSAFISYSLPQDNELQVNYTRRISRPWPGQLNPFVNLTDSTNISYGNPLLDPEYSNAFELNYIKTWDDHLLSISAYYRTTDDVIQRISYFDGTVMRSTHENITQSLSSGTEIVVKNKFFSRLDLTTTVNLFYYKLDGFTFTPAGATAPVTGNKEDDFSWNARIIANLSLPAMYSLQVTGNYNSKQVIAQGHRKANYSLDAGVRKSFGRISASVSGRDLLNSRKRKSVTAGTNYTEVSEGWFGGRQVGLTATYSFGNMNPKRQSRRNDVDPSGGYEMGGEF